VQLAAGKIWENSPGDCSIVEKRIHLCPPRKPPNQAVFRLFIGFSKMLETAKISTKKFIFSQIKFPSKDFSFEGLFSSKTALTTYLTTYKNILYNYIPTKPEYIE